MTASDHPPSSSAPLTYRPPSSRGLARRAGVLLIVLGGLAGLLGGGFFLFGLLLPRVQSDPGVKAMTDQLRAMSPIEPRVVILIGGSVMLAYAMAALMIGIGVLRGTRPWVIAAISLCGVVAGLMTLSVISNIATGNAAGVIEPVVILALHGLAIRWLIATLSEVSTPVFASPVEPHVPMREYYLLPIEPENRHEFARH